MYHMLCTLLRSVLDLSYLYYWVVVLFTTQALVSGGLAGGRALLGGLRDYWSAVRPPHPCEGALCYPHLCSPPVTPQTVYAALIQVTILCNNAIFTVKHIMLECEELRATRRACLEMCRRNRATNMRFTEKEQNFFEVVYFLKNIGAYNLI